MAEKLTIFISGTMLDLPKERERVAAAIRDMNLEPVWAEGRGATDRPSRDECERMARTCDVYLGLYGLGYGWKPPGETISATELEWQTAKRAGKPMLIYRQKGQPDPEQAAFLSRAGEWQQGRFWYEFETLDDLLPRLRDDLARLIADSFRPPRPALLADYRAHLRRLYADLPLAGIPVPLDVTLPLDRVYVRLRALPEREEAARRAATLPSGGEELPRRLAEHFWRQREEWEEAARRMEEARPIPPEEAIAGHDRLAILGEAGAGKSTLLRHLAWERAGDLEAPLPLLIPLGLADVQVSTTGSFLEAALDLLTEHKAGEERELLKQALADAIGEKRVLFLCDGLDEVHLARRGVIAGLAKLAADGQRLVVTSRPLGYERLAGKDMEHFQVLPLLPQDAEAFTDRWFGALAEARGVPEPERERWARERAGWLQRQLQERPGLREVAGNPLLLTFLAVLAGDDPRRDLPQRRKELYREYVERLFTVWEARRRREGKLALGDLSGEKARRVALWGLYRTGWHLHRAYYGEEGLRAVRGEIESLLARDLRERWEFDLLQAESLAAEVLRFWRGAGLLDVYRLAGQEWLAFRHLTFQEYGAARVLAEAHKDDAKGLWRCLSPHLLHPQWAGVIPLTLVHLPEAQATTLVERLLAANESDEDWQRPLFLAATALAEGSEVADGPHRRVVDGLLGIARTRRLLEFGEKADAGDAVGALGRMVGDEYAAVGLLALARDEAVEDRVRVWSAEILGRLGRVEELLALARDEAVEARVRVEAGVALGRLGRAEEAAELLLALAQDEVVEARVREEAAAALGWLGQVEEAAELLLALAQDEAVDARVRVEAAAALGRLGRAEEAAEFLLALARDEAVEDRVREWAAAALGWLGRAEELLALARDEAVEARVRYQAAEALGRLGQIEEAAELLLALTQDEVVAAWVRKEAAATLGRLGQVEEAVELLLALARGEAVWAWVRVEAAKALGRLGQVEEAAELLLDLARDGAVEDWVRYRAAEALGDLERAEELLALARDEAVEARVRYQAAEALSRLGRAEEMAELLLALARDEAVEARVRMAAAAALGRLGRAEAAAEFLLALARDEAVEDEVRYQAAKALGEMERTEELLALAQDEAVAAWMREDAATALGRLGRAEEAAELLLALARDEVVAARVQVEAAAALGRLGRAEEAAELLSVLARDKAVEARVRMAAAAALGRLGRAEEAAELLLALARDEAVEAWMREDAATALGRLGQVEEAAEVLLALARDQAVEDMVRVEAATALGWLGRADEAAEFLLALARGEAVKAWVRYPAAKALGEMERAEELLDLARDEAVEAWMREDATTALGRLGQATPEVVAGLRALVEELGTPERVRRAARKALRRLKG